MKSVKTLKKFKVLVTTPHNEVKNYCFDDFLATLTNLTYNNYDILIADNSKTHDNKKKLTQMNIPCVHIKPKMKSNQQYIADSQEALRLEAIRGGYDYMLMLESDIFPPLDIIERLLMHQKQVVGATYFIGEGSQSHLMIQDIEQRGNLVRETINIDGGFDFVRMNGKLQKVYNIGFGCLMLHKSVFEKINFHCQRGIGAHSDTFFYVDLNSAKIPVFLDTSILCRHENQSWATRLDAYKF